MNLNLNKKYLYFIKIIGFVSVFCLSGLFAFAQGNGFNPEEFAINVAHAQFKNKQVIPPTPEAASLGQYGNVPISLYTGTPNISVPLHTVPSSKISLPISLSYNAQGFKPQDIASWVGLGWSLNAGGVITRSVIGNPDILENYYYQQPITTPPSTQDMFAYYDLAKDMRDGRREDQSDIYYFNFGNYSGKFFVMRDGTVIKKSKDNLKISQGFGTSFTIQDEQGNTYFFSAAEETITNSGGIVVVPDDVYPVHSSYAYNSSWYLTGIYSADGSEIISLEYYSGGTHKQYENIAQTQSVTYSNKQEDGYGGSGCPIGVSGDLLPQIKTASVPTTLSTRKYLKKISIAKNSVVTNYIDFISFDDISIYRKDLDPNYFPGARRLDGIKIYNRLSNGSGFELEKEYLLNYGYFFRQTATGTNVEARLRLESVIEKPSGINTTQKPAYQFTYNPLEYVYPANMETAIDHWGFFNGTSNSSLIPNVQIAPNVFYGLGANRNPGDPSPTLLKKITYPTGGYSSFVYEGNTALDENGVFMNVGGARIKEIINYSFENKKAITKKYFYNNDDGTTSGKCQRPSYISNSSSYQKYPDLCTCNPNLPGGCNSCCELWSSYLIKSITLTASAVSGLGTIQGSHIGYTKVTEKQVEVTTGIELGKTVYDYQHTGFVLNDDDVFNGGLIKQTVYNTSNQLLSETTNEYQGGAEGSIVNWTFDVNQEQNSKHKLCKYTEFGTIYYGWRRIIEYSNLIPCISSRIIKTKLSITGYIVTPQYKYLAKQTQKIYDQETGAYITSVKEFTYGNNAHTLPTKITQTTSNNEVVITEKKYPLDYPNSSGDAASAAISSLQQANIVGAEIETVQYRKMADNGTIGTQERYVSGMLNIYQAGNPYPVQVYSLDIAEPLTNFQMSSINNGSFSYNSNYKLLGSFNYTGGNLITQSKANDIVTSYIWDYNYSHPTAQVINADHSMIAYTSFETDQKGQWGVIPNIAINRLGGGITGNFSYILTGGNNITHSSLAVSRQYIVSYWSKNGAITVSSNTGTATVVTGAVHNGWAYYEHKLPLNSTSVTISASYANIDELRIFPKDAQMTTMTYNRHNGSLMNQCSHTNSIASFEYDGYSRLINVKDIDGNIIKNYQYNYGLGTELTQSTQTLFYNDQKQGVYLKQGCPPESEPEPYTYIVGHGKYASIVSVAEANQKATQDVQDNGQATANQYGLCYYWNDVQSQVFVKNNCQYWEGPAFPNGYLYTVPAHTYYSLNSKAEANAKAVAFLNANGQNFTNTLNLCSCSSQGSEYRYVYGQCEMGQISYVGYVYEPGCAPGMNYRCYYVYTYSDGYHSAEISICSPYPCHNY
jgi:hypothetical protein